MNGEAMNRMGHEVYKEISGILPAQPGIYKYYNTEDELIYVGKAKNLKKRISSYFIKNHQSFKTHELVKNISRIEFTIVNNESDAFFLENSLIKQYQPYYNISLKDDKTYPYIIVKKEPFPRVFFTRKKINDGSEYLGPYTSVFRVRELLEFIKQTIPLRTCKLNLTERNIKAGKFKVCLEYHLGNCKGPCEGLQTLADYNEGLQQVKNLLKGNLQPIIKHFTNEMKLLASNLDFEKAALVKHRLDFVLNYQSKSIVAGSNTGDVDVFTIKKEAEVAFINFLMVRGGTIIQTHTTKAISRLDEPEQEILPQTIAQLRQAFNSDALEIVVPFLIDYPEQGVEITVPKAGNKKKLLELSEKNAAYFVEQEKARSRLHLNYEERDIQLLQGLQQDLQLKELPLHIECFDNSHFQGSYLVSAMVCFKNGQPSKKDYRTFNVKTVQGIDDFATMKEAVGRRYKRLYNEGGAFPQLVIIDGGKGQLNAAVDALSELGLTGKTTLIGLAKNEEEVFFVGDKESLKLPYNSESLKLLRRIRDEVHHFVINFHRSQRSRGTFKNTLAEINGIGAATADRLLKQFKSVNAVSGKSIEELSKIIGPAKAKVVFDYFNQ